MPRYLPQFSCSAGSCSPEQRCLTGIIFYTVCFSASFSFAQSSYEGSIEPVMQASVAAELPARISQVYVEAGQTVKKGQLLVALDGKASRAQAQSAKAHAQAAQAQADLASKDLNRKKLLFSHQYISQAALDQSLAALKAAQAQAQAAQAQALAAQTMANYQNVYAPFSGRVTQVNAKQGELSSPAVPLLHLYAPQKMRVVVQLPQSAFGASNEKQLASLLKQTRIHLKTDQGDFVTMPASVELIPAVNPQSSTRQVRFNLNDSVSRSSFPGQPASLELHLSASPSSSKGGSGADGSSVVYVPAGSVFHRGDISAVYVLKKGQRQLRVVREGPTRNGKTAVMAGLKLGEQVLKNPNP